MLRVALLYLAALGVCHVAAEESGDGSGVEESATVHDWADGISAEDDVTCPDLSAAPAAVAAACGADLQALRTVLYLGGGALDLCTDACGEALTTLASSAMRCSDGELEPYFGSNANNALKVARSAHAKCSPPSAKCMTTFKALERWEASAQGQLCFANAASIQSELSPGTAQAHSAALCNSQLCGGAMSAYISALEDAGCSDWGAYRLKRVEYDLVCYQSAAGNFCGGIFNMNKFRDTFRKTASNAASEADAESALASACTPCFKEYLKVMNRFSPFNFDSSGLYAAEKMCTEDRVGFARQFCYPRYRNRRRKTSDLGHNAKARELCATDMGNCARKMLIRDAAQESTESANNSLSDIDYMCLRRISTAYEDDGSQGSVPMLCADQMEAHVGGYNADGVFTGTPYTAPAACSNLVAVNDTCSWGCQRTFTPERDNFGCCYETIKEYYTLIGHEDVDSVFGNSDLVGKECNRPPDQKCDILNEAESVEGTIIVDVPVAYLRDSTPEIDEALMKDIERAVGRSASGLSIRGYRYHSATSTKVDFVIVAQDALLAGDMLASLELAKSFGGSVNLHLDRLYFNSEA